MKPHERRDLAELVFNRTCDGMKRATDVYAPSPTALGVAGNAAMRAGLFALYTGAYLECTKPPTMEQLLREWVEITLPTLKDFDKEFLETTRKVKS